MPRKAKSACTTSGCPALVEGGGKCGTCKGKAEQERGSASARGYGSKHRNTFRAGVLKRDPICVLCRTEPSTVADHHPLSRRQLIKQGMDPNNPKHGRGLCATCHGRETQATPSQRGGWNAR